MLNFWVDKNKVVYAIIKVLNNMKKINIIRRIAVLSAATLTGCGSKPVKETTASTAVETSVTEGTGVIFKPGIYEGRSQGFDGEIIAKVTLSETGIESVEKMVKL